MTAIVTQGDARDLLLPKESVDLIVTSPPYFGLRSYRDGGEHYSGQIGAEATSSEYLDALIACTAEWMRVLKPSGSIFVNLGDKYAGSAGWATGAATEASSSLGGRKQQRVIAPDARPRRAVGGAPTKSLIGHPWRYALRCIDDLGLILRSEIIWSKPNAMPEGGVTDRVARVHEQVFHFVKLPRYFAAVDEVREPHQSTAWIGRQQQDRDNPHRNDGGKVATTANPLGKVPGSVWSISTSPLRVPEYLAVDHFAAYPPELVRRLILGWSPRGGVVLDPFGGTGTTALVASVLGRVGISVDLSVDYCRLARWRTSDPKQRARVATI